MRYLIICMLMICGSLSAMKGHSSHHAPKRGQLVGIIPRDEQLSEMPIMMITHYQGLETYYMINDARRWYTCNMKDIKKLIKKDKPFYYMPNSMKGRSVAKLIDGHFIYYKYLEMSGSLSYLESIMDDLENNANNPEKIKELIADARDYLMNMKNALKSTVQSDKSPTREDFLRRPFELAKMRHYPKKQ